MRGLSLTRLISGTSRRRPPNNKEANKGRTTDSFEEAALQQYVMSDPEVIVRGRSILSFPDLPTAGEYYLSEYFPEWVKRRAACIVPPIPWTAYNRVLGPQLKPDSHASLLGKVRGDNAELMVYKTVFTWAEQHGEPVFFLAQVDYDPENKSKKVTSVLSSFLPDAKQPQLTLMTKKMDVDLAIVHVGIGAVIVEIKATINPLLDIGDALTSLHKGESLLRLFCDEAFPVYKVALFPNCAKESLSEVQVAEMKRLESKNSFVFADGATANSMEGFAKLFEGFKRLTGEKAILPEADKLLHWLISLKCLVSSSAKGGKVVKVSLNDETINVARQTKLTDTKVVQHDVYSKADQKSNLVRKLKISTEILYLNPEQLAVWDGPKQQLINGVAGTGKTVLIQHKVLELDRRLPPEELIAVIMTDGVSRVYQNFFDQNRASDRVKLYSKANALANMELVPSFCAHHLFIDEFQNMMDLKSLFLMIGKCSKDNYLWIALDPVQSLDRMGKTVEQLETELKIPCLPPLRHVMRCTPEVTHYWSKHLPADCPVLYSQGNRLFVQDVPVYHADNNDRAVSIILELLEKYVDGENVTYKDCAVLIHSPPLSIIPIRRGILGKLGYSEREYLLTNDDDAITVKDMPNDIWSLEWSYVFLVAQDAYLSPTEKELDARLNKAGYWNSGIYLASSRCKVQLFLVSMDKGWHPNDCNT